MYTIGVIITVYNKGSYVERALMSLLKQSVFPEQLVMVNDKSTDNSDKIINDYLPQLKARCCEVNYLNLSVNQGAAGARNAALKLMYTDFIVFLDADDQYETDYIQNLKFLLKDDIGMVASKVTMESNRMTYPSNKVLSTMLKCNDFYLVNTPLVTLAIESLFIGGGNLCFKREMMPDEWFIIKEKNFEEWDFYYRTLRNVLSHGLKFIYNTRAGYIYNDFDEQSLSRKYLDDVKLIRVPCLINRLNGKEEQGYRGLLISIWWYNALSRLRTFQNKLKFTEHNWEVIRHAQLNRYVWGGLFRLFMPESLVEKLKDSYKKSRYK